MVAIERTVALKQEKEFEQIYRDNVTQVHAFLYKLSGSPAVAEELTQETFYQAFLSLHRFKGNCRIQTWLISIAKHVYYAYLRKNKLGLDSISLTQVTEVFCLKNTEDPEDAYQKKAVLAAVRTILRRIPDKYRDVVMLRIYAEMSFAEVGAALNITENSAKVIYFRAKRMLMEELEHAHYL